MKHPTHWDALRRASEGTDAHRDRRPPFRGVGHALAWYLEHGERLRGAKTTMGVALDRAELGIAHDSGGRGSQLERDLVLLGDVGACLPRPRGEEPPTGSVAALCGDTWGRWWVMCASVSGASDLDELGRAVGARMGRYVSAEQARMWLRDGMREFRSALVGRGLLRGAERR